VFDSGVNKKPPLLNHGMQIGTTTKADFWRANFWRQRLALSLEGVAASGTLPIFRAAEHIDGYGDYWDGLYSQNPPVREFFLNVHKDDRPEELWVIRINPQQRKDVPKTNAAVLDRENELMGNLSLNKELDFIMTVNAWADEYGGKFADDHKHVTVRTIKMTRGTADHLQYSSKFDRSGAFLEEMRTEGQNVARAWLNNWPHVKEYPEDAKR
jgi:NTE family protein